MRCRRWRRGVGRSGCWGSTRWRGGFRRGGGGGRWWMGVGVGGWGGGGGVRERVGAGVGGGRGGGGGRGVRRIWGPGEGEFETEESYRRGGIPLNGGRVGEVRETAERLG